MLQCSTQVWLEEVLGWYSVVGIWVTSHIPLSQDGALTQPSNTPATVTGNQADLLTLRTDGGEWDAGMVLPLIFSFPLC